MNAQVTATKSNFKVCGCCSKFAMGFECLDCGVTDECCNAVLTHKCATTGETRKFVVNMGSPMVHTARLEVYGEGRSQLLTECGAGQNGYRRASRSTVVEVKASAPTCKRCLKKF